MHSSELIQSKLFQRAKRLHDWVKVAEHFLRDNEAKDGSYLRKHKAMNGV